MKSDYDVPDKRKRDILQGLENELHGLFTFFYNYLENQYNLHLQSKDSKIHILLVNRVLTTLSSFISWAPISSISDMHFPEIFCQLLPNYHFRMVTIKIITF